MSFEGGRGAGNMTSAANGNTLMSSSAMSWNAIDMDCASSGVAGLIYIRDAVDLQQLPCPPESGGAEIRPGWFRTPKELIICLVHPVPVLFWIDQCNLHF